jgi:branched-chain amino acid transport system substrate-binding protein
MVLVEGVKQAGKDVTREKFISAIESIRNMKVGLVPRLVLNYGAIDPKGFDRVYPTLVKNRRPVPLEDWASLGN